MRIPPLTGLLCALLALLAAFAQADPGMDYGPYMEVAFDQALARVTPDAQVEILTPMVKPVYEEQEETYTVMTKVHVEKIDATTGEKKTVAQDVPETRIRTVTVMKLVPVAKSQRWLLSQVAAFEIDGAPVAPETLAERLKSPTLVIVTHDGQPLPDYYAFPFKPGTLVIGVKVPTHFGIHAAQPVPCKPGFTLPCEPGFTLPAGLPPTFRLAQIDQQDRFALRMFRAAEQPITAYCTVTKKVVVDNVEKEIQVCVPVTMKQQMQTTLTTLVPRQHVKATTAEGQPLEDRHLNALKQREYAVMVSRDGQPVDKFWLTNLKPRVPVLVPPTTSLPARPADTHLRPPVPAVPMPAPVPPSSPPSGSEPRAQAPPAAGGELSHTEEAFLSDVEREVLELVNRERLKAALPPLKASRQLTEAARGHAANMARQGQLNHTLDGKRFDQRIEATGFRFTGAGENIFLGPTASQAIATWMSSPGHRRNILSPSYQEIGIGVSGDKSSHKYWTQVFATPARQASSQPAARQASAPDTAWIGRSVVPKPGIQLRVAAPGKSLDWKTVGPLPWQVTHERDQWVWIGKAWAQKSQVVRLGDTPRDKGLARFSEAVRKEPANTWHYVNRSYYWEPHDVPSTIEDLTEAVRLDPKNEYAAQARLEALERQRTGQPNPAPPPSED